MKVLKAMNLMHRACALLATIPPTATPTPVNNDPSVTPRFGSVTTSTVFIISPAGGLTGATDVFVHIVKTRHTVINDTRINFLMRPGVSGSTVDVIPVRAGGGVTISVPPQTALRPASAEVGGSLGIPYTPADQPAEPPGNAPRSFFDVGVVIEDSPVTVPSRLATLELSVDLTRVPAGERPRLYQWTPCGRRSVGAGAGPGVRPDERTSTA